MCHVFIELYFRHVNGDICFPPQFSYLKTCMDQFNASSDLLIEELRTKADGKTELTMLEELGKVFTDIIGKVGIILFFI